MSGIKMYQGNSFSKPKRTPVTPALLRKLGLGLFRSPLAIEDKLMLWAAMTAAFFGFLRVSEYTTKLVRSFDPAVDLCFQDLTICPNRVELTLKASKTDPFRQGVVIRLSANGTTLCPVSAMKRYLQACSNMTGPLFQFKDGRYLTRKSFMTALNLVKPHEINNMSTHSFRIGAATAAAAAGYPRWAIQAMGRWSSDCYRTYIRISDDTIAGISRAMAFALCDDATTFDPDNA